MHLLVGAVIGTKSRPLIRAVFFGSTILPRPKRSFGRGGKRSAAGSPWGRSATPWATPTEWAYIFISIVSLNLFR